METPWQHPSVITQTQIIARSLKHWTGRDLLSGHFPTSGPAWAGNKVEPAGSETGAPFADKVFHAPFVLVSHGTEADPVLNYGNAAALALWEMSWAELTRTPSRLTAEAPNREERARLLAAVTARGFIDDYSGVRISKTGRRFKISQATVWNLLTEAGKPCGQAAMFSAWGFL
ncbi:MAG TPA: MEKHLA domain-containing protein [Verrucomicrobiae bacterium]|nr:MEKHLA domain-containing protein [Verrucomicrobiae bacterium]